MPSEHRLHPASILFRLAAQVREFAVPLLLALVAGSSGGNLDTWASLVLIPYALVAIGRYVWFRYRFEPGELVVRSGLIVRNERHIPYTRIQNLDAVRNVFHRALGVVDVRVDTGSGSGADARLTVVTWEAYEDMRRRVFAERVSGETPVEAEPASGRPGVLLDLPSRELVLHGLVENRGAIVIAGAFGLLAQTGVMDRLVTRYLDDDTAGGGFFREIARGVLGADAIPWGLIAIGGLLFVALLVLVRAFSVGLSLVRLHGFRLTRSGDDLRAEYGLLTRVIATIPLRRIQMLTVTEGLLHRWLGRVSVQVDTAGGAGPERGGRGRESLAPIIGQSRWPDFVGEVLPEVDLAAAAWQGPAPGALLRETRARLILPTAIAGLLAYWFPWVALTILAVFGAWAALSARRYIAHLGWAVIDGAVLFRSGWLRRHVSVARFTRIQNVSMHESPFDRRRDMARVSVDTAGAGSSSHRVSIPYMARDAAVRLHEHLAVATARTAFHW
jgi:putative membrane protein